MVLSSDTYLSIVSDTYNCTPHVLNISLLNPYALLQATTRQNSPTTARTLITTFAFELSTPQSPEYTYAPPLNSASSTPFITRHVTSSCTPFYCRQYSSSHVLLTFKYRTGVSKIVLDLQIPYLLSRPEAWKPAIPCCHHARPRQAPKRDMLRRTGRAGGGAGGCEHPYGASGRL